MKKLIFILLFIPLISLGQENVLNRETIKDEYIKTTDGITYYNGKPYTGVFYRNYENGKLDYKINYKDGKKNGYEESYYENGQLWEKKLYKDGKENGLSLAYYETGELSDKVNYKDDKRDGSYEIYHKNGNLNVKRNYKDGIEGFYAIYYENGQIQRTGNKKNGRPDGLIKYYHSNGQLMSKANYKDAKKYGYNESFYSNGQLWKKQNYKDDKRDGLNIWYHKNGNLNVKANYKDGIENGLYEKYDKNGQLKEKLLYENGLIKLNFRSLIGDTNIEDVNVYDLQAMIRLFLKDCELNNIKLPSDYKITSTFEPLDDGVLALAFGIFNDEEIIIRVNPKEWSNASNPKRWYIMYHELGHDVLNLQHGQGGKMMFNYTEKDYTWGDFFKDKDYMFNSMKSK